MIICVKGLRSLRLQSMRKPTQLNVQNLMKSGDVYFLSDATAAYKLYEDSGDKFSLLVPQEWSKGEGMASGQRKVTAFFPVDDSFTNVNVVITGLGADYTSLGSFGTADAFAENLVNSLDRSWKKPPGQAAKLINSRSREGMYYVEYTIERPGERKRHLLSVVGIGFNGWVNRLYTVSGQVHQLLSGPPQMGWINF
jgi:hypothetical protein